jgi:hypothetical protein
MLVVVGTGHCGVDMNETLGHRRIFGRWES